VISGNSGNSANSANSGSSSSSSSSSGSSVFRGITGGSLPGSGSGIFISSGALDNTVIGNLIGTDGTGNRSVSNAIGVEISAASGNTVGGTALGDENVISGNTQDGVEISNSAASGNIVEGNVLGLDEGRGTPVLNPDLTTALPKTALPIGVLIEDSPANIIGGTANHAANTIGGFAIGVEVTGVNASGNAILGDHIGTPREGSTFSIGYGVYLANVVNNTIGGTTPAARNVIQGYSAYGVYIFGPQATKNVVTGNQIIGSRVLKENEPPLVGIAVKDSSGNILGGTTSAAGNTITGNNYAGIYIFGQGSGTPGNYIGRNELDHNAYGILLYNDTIDGDYQTLHRRNHFKKNDIAPVREYSGPVTSGGGSMPAAHRKRRKQVHRAASHPTRLHQPHARLMPRARGVASIERSGRSVGSEGRHTLLETASTTKPTPASDLRRVRSGAVVPHGPLTHSIAMRAARLRPV
jgi:hypothetical protein